MLVLQRYSSSSGSAESDVVLTLPDGRRVTVRLLSSSAGSARIGVEGPPDVQINRAEVQQRIDAGRVPHRAEVES